MRAQRRRRAGAAAAALVLLPPAALLLALAAPPAEMRGDAGGPPLAAAVDRSVPYVGAGGEGQPTGKGVVIAVIDTGVDGSHPDFAAGGGSRVEAAHDLFGGGSGNDTDGHGTGVAGVAAAGGALRGVAPDARIVSYRVSDHGESVSSDLIVEAIRRAVLDGADVINISLGVNRSNSAIDAAVSEAAAAGAVVVAAAGNDGPAPGSIGSPGINRMAITVAATHNDLETSAVATLEAGGRHYQALPMLDAPVPGGPVSGPVAEGGHATEADLEGGGYAGSILLAERGGGAGGGPVYFSDKERNAADAGAAALVVYNSGDGPYLGELVHEFSPEGYSPRIPTVSMSGEDGREIAGMLAGRGGEGLEGTLLVLHDPDAVAQFSSRGPVSPFYVKPDLAAPGAFINTTQAGGGYNFTSGTSFAAPHVAGAAALLLERSPGLRPEEVRSILVSTADPSGAGLGAAGAGRLNVTAALGASLAPSPSHVSFDLSPAGPEDSAGLLLEAVRGRAGAGGGGPPRVEVDAPDGVLASHEVRDAGNGSWAVDVSARLAPDAPAAPGTGEGMVTARDGASRYSVPAIFRIAEGTVLASEEGGRVSFAVEGPGGWRYARITATDSETGRAYAAAARPGEPASVEVARNGTYWVEAEIRLGEGGAAAAFGEVEVRGAREGAAGWEDGWEDGHGIPARAALAVGAVSAAALAAGAAAGRAAGPRRPVRRPGPPP